MNVFRSSAIGNTWVVPVSAMAMVVGVMISMAWITQKTRTSRTMDVDMIGRTELPLQYDKVQAEVAKLREENTRLQNLLSNQDSASTELNTSLQKLKLFAALTEVEGPGISVKLSDSHKPNASYVPYDNLIHDVDVLKVVNELWNAGAEAVAVGKNRVGPWTNFRCVGSTILVDGNKVASPIIVQAIGDPDTLFGAIDMPDGVLKDLRNVDPSMAEVDVLKRCRLPAYAGSTNPKFAKAVGAKP